jgi:tRNA threonylcarbamoyl adenosine modification protein YeaZ
VAVVRAGEVLFEEAFVSERSHNSMLYAPLEMALGAAGADLGLIVVGTGPGSYTGVRISIAAAQGVGLSRRVPVMGWPSIAALHDGPSYAVAGDARRGRCYVARVRERHHLEPLELIESGATGDWVRRSGMPVFSSDAKPPAPGVELRLPCAIRLAQIASHLGEETVWTLMERPLEPLYVQEAFITQPKAGGVAGSAASGA